MMAGVPFLKVLQRCPKWQNIASAVGFTLCPRFEGQKYEQSIVLQFFPLLLTLLAD